MIFGYGSFSLTEVPVLALSHIKNLSLQQREDEGPFSKLRRSMLSVNVKIGEP